MWMIGRVKHGETTPGQINEIADWLRTLDLDPNRFMACAAIVQHGTQHELHLSERVLDERGAPQWDHAYDKAYTRPVVVLVDEGSWPAWLTGLNNTTVRVKTRDKPSIQVSTDGGPVAGGIGGALPPGLQTTRADISPAALEQIRACQHPMRA